VLESQWIPLNEELWELENYRDLLTLLPAT